MYNSRFQYFIDNWKLGIHLLFRTKRFGVNNQFYSLDDSIFGWSWYKILFGIITIQPILDNYHNMKWRSCACHFLSDSSFELAFGHHKPNRTIMNNQSCGCGTKYEVDCSEFGLPLGYNRRCTKCGKLWKVEEEINFP